MAAISERRLAFVDVARGMSIALVVVMHSTLGVGKAMGEAGFMHALVDFATPFRIPAFFLVAGLFAGASLVAPPRRFLDGKVLHFAYFYLLWAAIQIVAKDFLGAGLSAPHALREAALALVEPYGVLWFIYLLPVFFVVARATREIDPRFVMLIAAGLNVLDVQTGWTVIDQFAERFVFFFAGCAYAPFFLGLADKAVSRRGLATLALLLWGANEAMLTGTGEGRMLASQFGAPLALGLSGAVALIAFARLIAESAAGRLVGALGRRSLVVYLAFFLPMVAARVALVRSGAIEDVGLVSLIVSIAAILGPLALERLVARTPLNVLFVRPRPLRLAEIAAPDAAPRPRVA